MKKQFAVCGLLAVLLIGMTMPVSSGRATAAPLAAHVASGAHSHPAILDKTRFVLHMGFAYYAFHHFVYARFHHKVVQPDGTVTYENLFAKGAPHRTANLVKAALALLFTVHELKVAYKIARNSHSRTLQVLVAPLTGLAGLAGAVYAKLRGCRSNEHTAATPTPLPTAENISTPAATPVSSGGCQYSDSDIMSLNNSVNAFTKISSRDGVSISDKAVPVPGAS